MDEHKKTELIFNALTKKRLFPHELEIRPSANCNLKCIICDPRKQFLEGKNYVNRNKQLELVTKETYERIIKESANLGISTVGIGGGGEPFIRKDIIAIMKSIKEKGLYGRIVTNGTLLTKDIIKKMIQMQWDCIIISINGPNRQLDDLIRNRYNSFARSINNIRKIVEMKKINQEILINYVICKYNQYRILDFIKLVKKLKVNKISFNPITVPKGYKKEFNLEITNKYKKYFRISMAFALKNGIITNLDKLYDFYFEEEKNYNQLPICFEPLYKIAVQPNGNADPCPVVLKDAHREIKMNNIKYRTLKDIWNETYFKEFRKMLLMRKMPNKKYCRFCCGIIQTETNDIKEQLIKYYHL